MKIVRFSCQGETGYGILEDNEISEVLKPSGDWDIKRLKPTGRRFKATAVRLLAPVEPSKIICIGLNYRSHATEVKLPLPEQPVIFIKPSTSVIGPEETIRYPKQSRRVDYEAELGVVIGREACRVEVSQALNYALGYTCANDITARDLQPARGQWTYSKGFDTFCPLGPVVETSIDNPENLHVKGYLNGTLKQSAPTSEHIFSVAELISFISNCMTLLPGDVIITGTPSGIGRLNPGDEFIVEIGGIGRLRSVMGDKP